MNLGEKIYQLRKAKGYSQEALAKELNVSRQAVSKWEVSETLPDMENLKKLADIFAVSIDELLEHEVAAKKTSKIDWKTILISSLISLLMVGIGFALTSQKKVIVDFSQMENPIAEAHLVENTRGTIRIIPKVKVPEAKAYIIKEEAEKENVKIELKEDAVGYEFIVTLNPDKGRLYFIYQIEDYEWVIPLVEYEFYNNGSSWSWQYK